MNHRTRPHGSTTTPEVTAGGAVADRPDPRHRRGGLWRRLAGERGAATAEYAVATMAAVGFAGLLVVILRGDEVRGILTDLVRNALSVG
ncbi:DUF4244 domain-containing protein [Agromyces mediolanus]|uniref:DUF4244 domain-containing protein n=1 Tax=Agromyces mediolanus TaxID=41986 RepID=UPI00203C8940|nr:DUF4244 domain-containing protein [Agromyces mediolanus]MCM3656035.1 DUF4244 domain-containing protein [Agromyces mediolanus]